APCEPSAAALVARERPPTACAHTLAARIAPATDRTRARDQDETGRTTRRAIQSNLRVRDDLNRVDAEANQTLAHALAQVRAAHAGETHFGCDDVRAPHASRIARLIHSLAHGRCRRVDAHAQRVRRPREAFAKDAPVLV